MIVGINGYSQRLTAGESLAAEVPASRRQRRVDSHMFLVTVRRVHATCPARGPYIQASDKSNMFEALFRRLMLGHVGVDLDLSPSLLFKACSSSLAKPIGWQSRPVFCKRLENETFVSA